MTGSFGAAGGQLGGARGLGLVAVLDAAALRAPQELGLRRAAGVDAGGEAGALVVGGGTGEAVEAGGTAGGAAPHVGGGEVAGEEVAVEGAALGDRIARPVDADEHAHLVAGGQP